VLLRVAKLGRTRGVIAVAVLHDLNLAALADRVVVLDAGAVIVDGPPVTALAPDVVGRVFGDGLAVMQVGARTVVLPR